MAEVDDSAQAARRRETHVRLQRAFFKAEVTLPLALLNVLFAALLTLMLWDTHPPTALAWWVAAVVGVALLDIWRRGQLRRQGEHVRPTYDSLMTIIDVLAGLTWLWAVFALFPDVAQERLFYLLFAVGAAALCTVVYQHYFLRSCFLRVGLALPAAALHVFLLARPFAVVQALVLMLVWLTILWLALKLHSSLIQRLELTTNRDALLQHVAENARQLDLLRANEARSRKQAESANLAKSRFLAHSSHDLRQPLHAIRLLLETVDDTVLDRDTRHVIGRVRQSIDALGKLFDSLLDLTLLDTGQMQVRDEDCPLRKLLEEVAQDFAELARTRRVQLTVDAPEHYIRADPTIVLRMVQNLAANAIRHSPDGEVVLRGRTQGDEVWIDVIDNGSGIAHDDQDVIFDEFTRISDGTKDNSTGRLGLGLSIVSRLAALTNIEVRLDSTPGYGSTFSLGPLLRGNANHGREIAPLGGQSTLAGLRIIVVDDDADTLEATGRLLRKWGLDVHLAQSVDELDAADANLLVCDVELGSDLDGIDVARQVCNQSNRQIKALLISGNASRELAQRARQNDLTLLHKPVQPAQLKSAILTLVGTN